MMSKYMYGERTSSQEPALEILQKLGYEYISQEKAVSMRDNLYHPVLTTVLKEQIEKINEYEYKGRYYSFSEANVARALRDIDIPLTEGLVNTNEKIYDLLMLGKSYEEFMPDGNRRSFNINFIDWNNPGNNVYHVTDEFKVERENGREHIFPDIVLFINGIPIGVIENKRSSIPVSQAVSQMIRNQKPDFTPQLFKYTQIVLGTNKNEVKYETCNTRSTYMAICQVADVEWLSTILNDAIQHREIKIGRASCRERV